MPVLTPNKKFSRQAAQNIGNNKKLFLSPYQLINQRRQTAM